MSRQGYGAHLEHLKQQRDHDQRVRRVYSDGALAVLQELFGQPVAGDDGDGATAEDNERVLKVVSLFLTTDSDEWIQESVILEAVCRGTGVRAVMGTLSTMVRRMILMSERIFAGGVTTLWYTFDYVRFFNAVRVWTSAERGRLIATEWTTSDAEADTAGHIRLACDQCNGAETYTSPSAARGADGFVNPCPAHGLVYTHKVLEYDYPPTVYAKGLMEQGQKRVVHLPIQWTGRHVPDKDRLRRVSAIISNTFMDEDGVMKVPPAKVQCGVYVLHKYGNDIPHPAGAPTINSRTPVSTFTPVPVPESPGARSDQHEYGSICDQDEMDEDGREELVPYDAQDD